MSRAAHTIDIVIDRPVADVFAYVSDPDHLPEWLSGITDVVKSAPVMSVGASYQWRRKAFARHMEGTTTVTAFEPPTRYAYRLHTGSQEADVTYELVALGNGTLLKFSVEAEVHGFFGVAPGLVVSQYEKDLQRMKELLQGPAYGHRIAVEGTTGSVV